MTAAGGIEAVVVAAGRSQRMGAVNKLLLPVGGIPMIRHSVELYARLASPVAVVIGEGDLAVADALAGLDVRLVENRHVDIGQQESVRLGLSAADLVGRGLLIALADQPLLTRSDLEQLIACFDAHEGRSICVPRHDGERGNPVLFPAALAKALRQDDSQPGCRRFIDRHPELTTWFDADNDHFTTDVDTPQDALRVLGIGELPG